MTLPEDEYLRMIRTGLEALRHGEHVKAAQIGELATRLAPALADGWVLLSAALGAMGSIDEERAIRDGLIHIPKDDPARIMLEADRARALAKIGRTQEAIEILERLELEPSLPARQRDVVGSVYAAAGLFDQAVPHCEAATAQLQDNAIAHYNLGTALRYIGRMDEAEAAFERALVLEPDLNVAHASLAAFRKWTPERNHVPRLEAALARAQRDPEGKARLQYALFKELDDQGKTEQAWAALAAGAATASSIHPFRAPEKKARTDALISTFSRERLANAGQASFDVRPIFIVGLPRSGTTLTERILAGHSLVRPMGETLGFTIAWRSVLGLSLKHDLTTDIIRSSSTVDWRQVAQGYLRNVSYLTRDATVVTEKLPHNYEWVGPIHLAFPQSPVVHVRRGPMDSLFGALKIMFGEDAYPWSYSLQDLAENYRQYRRLMRHWREALGGVFTEVILERLIDDPEPEIRRLLTACGLSFEPACLTPHEVSGGVSTASSAQIRRPINRQGVGAWRRYEKQLEPLRAALEQDGFVDRTGEPIWD